ncbi:1-deoxy-D-xylulose-5-phosphate synthase [Armatimonas sp.]|uniref:1-deoxy-D-xylulose-5-phosphate synthase n=1 Tax=Armatimonas sp. TaxID=1872638 RepID=UPI0037511E62
MDTFPILDQLTGPADLKAMDSAQLKALCNEVRQGLIQTISRVGGHFAPNLGVVELTVALYKVFELPKDKVIWDVGHQCYPHKMLTGRWKQLHTIKQYQGISGFLRRDESEYDLFGAGHASTSLSAALGFAKARDLRGSTESVIGVIGDGSLTGGMALEALLNIGDQKTKMLVVLNDNEMSIAENVGALATYLAKLRLMPTYQKVESTVKRSLNKDGLLYRTAAGAKHAATHFAAPANTGIFFEELGFQYIGPIDGHDTDFLVQVFEHAKHLDGPVLLHILTTKGKGYEPAEKDQRTWHATTGFSIEDGKMEKKSSGVTYTQAFVESLNEVAVNNDKVVAITAAMPDGTGLAKFADKFPKRFFDVGIAEQHAVTFAAGLAAEGFTPVCAIYSTFLQRAYDQIVHDVCIQNLPVVFMIDRAGLVGDDGATHHGTMDIAYLRSIPNLVLLSPKDPQELREMVKFALAYRKGPIALRYPRGGGENLTDTCVPIQLGQSETLRRGDDLGILTYGPIVSEALIAANTLESQGHSVEVINARWVKPLDEVAILALARRTKKLITVEDGILAGGFGSAIIELLADRGLTDVQVTRIGLPNHFVEHGPIPKLRELVGMDAAAIVGVAESLLKLKQSTVARA